MLTISSCALNAPLHAPLACHETPWLYLYPDPFIKAASSQDHLFINQSCLSMATPITASHEDEEKTAPPSSPLTPSHTKEEVVDACQGLLIMAGLCRTTSSGSTSCGTPMTSPPRPRSYFDHSPWDMFYNDTTPHWGLPSLNPLGRVGSMILDHPAPNIAPYPLSGNHQSFP